MSEVELKGQWMEGRLTACFPGHSWEDSRWKTSAAPSSDISYKSNRLTLLSCNKRSNPQAQHQKWAPIFATGDFTTTLPEHIRFTPGTFMPLHRMIGSVVNHDDFNDAILLDLFDAYSCSIQLQFPGCQSVCEVTNISGFLVLFLVCAVHEDKEACCKLLSSNAGDEIAKGLHTHSVGPLVRDITAWFISHVDIDRPGEGSWPEQLNLRFHYLLRAQLPLLSETKFALLGSREVIEMMFNSLLGLAESGHFTASQLELTNNLNNHMYGAIIGVIQVTLLERGAKRLQRWSRAWFCARYTLDLLGAVAGWTANVNFAKVIGPLVNPWMDRLYNKKAKPYISAINELKTFVSTLCFRRLEDAYNNDPYLDWKQFKRHAVNAILFAIATTKAENIDFDTVGSAKQWESFLKSRPRLNHTTEPRDTFVHRRHYTLYSVMWSIAFTTQPDPSDAVFLLPADFPYDSDKFAVDREKLQNFTQLHHIIKDNIATFLNEDPQPWLRSIPAAPPLSPSDSTLMTPLVTMCVVPTTAPMAALPTIPATSPVLGGYVVPTASPTATSSTTSTASLPPPTDLAATAPTTTTTTPATTPLTPTPSPSTTTPATKITSVVWSDLGDASLSKGGLVDMSGKTIHVALRDHSPKAGQNDITIRKGELFLCRVTIFRSSEVYRMHSDGSQMCGGPEDHWWVPSDTLGFWYVRPKQAGLSVITKTRFGEPSRLLGPEDVLVVEQWRVGQLTVQLRFEPGTYPFLVETSAVETAYDQIFPADQDAAQDSLETSPNMSPPAVQRASPATFTTPLSSTSSPMLASTGVSEPSFAVPTPTESSSRLLWSDVGGTERSGGFVEGCGNAIYRASRDYSSRPGERAFTASKGDLLLLLGIAHPFWEVYRLNAEGTNTSDEPDNHGWVPRDVLGRWFVRPRMAGTPVLSDMDMGYGYVKSVMGPEDVIVVQAWMVDKVFGQLRLDAGKKGHPGYTISLAAVETVTEIQEV